MGIGAAAMIVGPGTPVVTTVVGVGVVGHVQLLYAVHAAFLQRFTPETVAQTSPLGQSASTLQDASQYGLPGVGTGVEVGVVGVGVEVGVDVGGVVGIGVGDAVTTVVIFFVSSLTTLSPVEPFGVPSF